MRTPFTSLQTFWADFTRVPGPIFLPAQSDPDTVGKHFDLVFGSLAVHRVGELQHAPFVTSCTNCRNNEPGEIRRASVCETHVGALRGTLEALSGLPLEIRYDPGEQTTCTITASAAAPRPL